jgi:Spy/CpxP family protein refolding chaperone
MSSNLKSWLLLAGIFIVGVVTGSALTIGLGPHFHHPPEQRDFRKSLMAHLTERLSLTADQQSKIQPILADAESKIRALHRDELERGSQIFKETNAQISALLTPAQQAELQKMESEREKLFNGHMRPWGPPHDGPGGMPPPPPPGPNDDGRVPPPPLPPPSGSGPTNAPPPAGP